MKTAVILDGKSIAKAALAQIAYEVSALTKKGPVLTLATIRIGDSQDALLYSNAIAALLNKLGIKYNAIHYPENAKSIQPDEIIQKIKQLNSDKAVTGAMIFAPVPKSLENYNFFEKLDPRKDVEGRRLAFGVKNAVMPPTAEAAVALVKASGIDIKGKKAVVIGRSDTVGKPAAFLLLKENATVTICHSKTQDVKSEIMQADIVIAALGKADFVQGDWIKAGAVVIDVGENMVSGKVVGDVDFDAVKKKCGFITPVPGGVGPLTNVMLVANLIKLYEAGLSAH